MSFIKQYVFIFAVCILLVMLLTGCDTFENKMKARSCQPIHSMCESNESLLICDSADKRECRGWLIE
jgi:uncharacterized lipoprotein YajG